MLPAVLQAVAGEAAAPLQPPHSFDDYSASKGGLGFVTCPRSHVRQQNSAPLVLCTGSACVPVSRATIL